MIHLQTFHEPRLRQAGRQELFMSSRNSRCREAERATGVTAESVKVLSGTRRGTADLEWVDQERKPEGRTRDES